MKTIQLDIPDEIDSELTSLGITDLAGVTGWIADAIRQKLSAAKQLAYLQSRAARGDEERFREVLSRVPAAEPAVEDQWR